MINLELPDLPYSKDALMPYMSAETLELHHDKHHMAYITNGNKFIKEQNISDDNVNDIVMNSYQKNAPVFNNVAQHINHVHFWEVMKNNPNGKIPSELENKIVSDNEIKSLSNLKRGIYFKNDLKKNQVIKENDIFFAIPYDDSQFESGEWSNGLILKKDVFKNESNCTID